MTVRFIAEEPRHQTGISTLLDLAFGPERLSRVVYSLRCGDPAPGLSFVAEDDGETNLIASLRFWQVEAGVPALLLGPLAVRPDWQGRGIATALVSQGLSHAAAAGHRLCLVSGRPDYYRRFAFRLAEPLGIHPPGPIGPNSLLALELAPGGLDGAGGTVRPMREPAALSAAG